MRLSANRRGHGLAVALAAVAWAEGGAACTVASNVGGGAGGGKAASASSSSSASTGAGGAMPACMPGPATWSKLATTNPPAPGSAATAYDANRHVMVVYGGDLAGDTTREFDGTAWTQRCTDAACKQSTPGARFEQGMAFDRARGKTVLFGGYNGNLLGDTWEWDGMAWTQVATTGPSKRIAPLAYDAKRKVTVLFGGGQGDGVTFFDDTWEWDGKAWTQRTPVHKPPKRSAAGMSFDTVRGVMVLFGGYGGSRLGDTWEWDGTDWKLVCDGVACAGPSPRDSQGQAFDEARGLTVVFGGSQQGGNPEIDDGDTWAWSGTAWTSIATSGPGPRRDAEMVYDTAGARTWLFYGYGPGAGYYTDGWQLVTACK